MLTAHTGPTLLSIAHAAREDDLRRAAEHHLRTLVGHESRPGRARRPWWWGLARARAT